MFREDKYFKRTKICRLLFEFILILLDRYDDYERLK